MIGDLLVERSRLAEQRCRARLAQDLAELARSSPVADTAFDPTRRQSQHDYDVNARIRVLEAYINRPCDMREGIDVEPAVTLCDADDAIFREAVALILSDQDHFSRQVEGQ